jgi:hypothetical protein
VPRPTSQGNWRSSPRSYRATPDIPGKLAQFTAKLPRAERRRRGTPKGSRALTCFWEAVLRVRWFRDRTSPDALARDHDISRATAYRYLDEVIAVLASEAPDLRQALERARDEGFPHVIPNGKVIPRDRRKEPAVSMKGQVIGLWYAGKAHAHGGNVQAVPAPDGSPLRVPEVEPGSVHDLTAARAHAFPALYPAAAAGLPAPADPGYDSASTGILIPVKQPPDARNWTPIPAPATSPSGRRAARANQGSPHSTSAGPPSTSPPAPAKQATSPAPHSSPPNSSTATSHENR